MHWKKLDVNLTEQKLYMKTKTRKSKTNCLVKMSPAFKKKVVVALRSGEYKQSQEYLYNSTEGGYCCLGLMSKLCGVSDKDLEYKELPDNLSAENYKKLVPFLRQDLYVDQDSDDSIILKLAQMNDDGKSFKQIAAYIERYL